MPFVNENINQVIESKRNADPDFKKAWDESREEYRLIGEMISLRKEEKMTQIAVFQDWGVFPVRFHMPAPVLTRLRD